MFAGVGFKLKTLGIIGVGAFGTLVLRELEPHFEIRVSDLGKDQTAKTTSKSTTLEEVALSDVIVLCVPVQQINAVATTLAGLVRPGALVVDVASVKVKPAAILESVLPKAVDIVCTHPLFGPQSAKNGITGLNISVCHVRGSRTQKVIDFLTNSLSLSVIETTPDEHDRELAYVQGLTHLIGKILLDMKLEQFQQTTKSFSLLMEAISYVQHDSEELFAAIERDNPYAQEARERFFDAATALAKRLSVKL